MNKYIQRLIKEQFNISDLNFSDDADEYDANIFSKNIETIDYYKIYNKILNCKATRNDTQQLNDFILQNDYIALIKPKNKEELEHVITHYSHSFDNYCNTYSLNWLDVSEITDMSYLFASHIYLYRDYDIINYYNGDISKWNVSNVKNMSGMFYNNSYFNLDISGWDVSNVINMNKMFEKNSKFNLDISGWDVSNVITMQSMFSESCFNSDISRWNVSNVKHMRFMFQCSVFNLDISGWDVSNVRKMTCMFLGSKFNQDISQWDVSNVIDDTNIFDRCAIKEKYKPLKFRKRK